MITGLVAYYSTEQISILVFFFGGMLIFPFSILISKVLKRSGKHDSKNPLSRLALESTALLFIGLFIAYVVNSKEPLWFYTIMLMTIGGRYLIFQSLF